MARKASVNHSLVLCRLSALYLGLYDAGLDEPRQIPDAIDKLRDVASLRLPNILLQTKQRRPRALIQHGLQPSREIQSVLEHC